jgi:GMP synthase-like glutamine amidotransferase
VRALFIGNEGDNHPGFIGNRAEFHGFTLEPLLREQAHRWPDLDGVDLVLSLGSEWSVYWDRVQSFVQPEMALLQEAARREIPTFGICFGSQLLAAAHGATVSKSVHPEIGWFSVTPSTSDDGMIEPGPWFQWHDDRWTLPSGATLVAANESANQAFWMGRTFATQFHPELTEGMLRNWLRLGGSQIMVERGLDAEAILAETILLADQSEERAHRLFDRFMKAVV